NGAPPGFPPPGGTVTYFFYATDNPTFGTTPVDTADFNPGGTTPGTYTVTINATDGSVPDSINTQPLGAGKYPFIAEYSGDSVYVGSVSGVEPLNVTTGTPPVLTTTILDSGGGAVTNKLGESVYDTSTFGTIPAGVVIPTGMVTYYFYATATPT